MCFKTRYMRVPADKGGVPATEAASLARHVQKECPALVFTGLMTIGAFNHDLSLGPNPDFQVSTVICLPNSYSDY